MSTIRVAHLSDWHGTSDSVKYILDREKASGDAELVLITGDMLWNTLSWRVGDFDGEAANQRAEWCAMVEEIERFYDGAELVAVPGNHDYCKYTIDGHVRAFDTLGKVETWRVGGLRLAGFRGVPYHHGAWNDEVSEEHLGLAMACVPTKTQILLTHTPPFGILDAVHEGGDFNGIRIPPRYIGSKGVKGGLPLLKNLKLHCFGHVHEKGGESYQNGARFSNAACTVNEFEIEV